MSQDWIHALVGGALIGLSVSLMLLWNGRVTGISGILNSTLSLTRNDTSWRVSFLAGLILGGLTLKLLMPDALTDLTAIGYSTTAAAGLLVGFGTVMAGGCTSGHGVCGISRLSLRSVIATIVFIVFGILSVYFARKTGVLP